MFVFDTRGRKNDSVINNVARLLASDKYGKMKKEDVKGYSSELGGVRNISHLNTSLLTLVLLYFRGEHPLSLRDMNDIFKVQGPVQDQGFRIRLLALISRKDVDKLTKEGLEDLMFKLQCNSLKYAVYINEGLSEGVHQLVEPQQDEEHESVESDEEIILDYSDDDEDEIGEGEESEI